MPVTLNVNGTDFDYPQKDDENWGEEATGWAEAVTAGMLQKAGGLFTLTAEVDFGASFGVKSLIYKTRTASLAASGEFRLANVDSMAWRNGADSGKVYLFLTPSQKTNRNTPGRSK